MVILLVVIFVIFSLSLKGKSVALLYIANIKLTSFLSVMLAKRLFCRDINAVISWELDMSSFLIPAYTSHAKKKHTQHYFLDSRQ